MLLSLVNRVLGRLVINFPRKTPKILHFHFIPRPIGEDLGYTRSYTNNKHSSRQFAPCAQYVFDIPVPRHIITQTNPTNIFLITRKGK